MWCWWWLNFSIVGEYALVFHDIGERARLSESIQDDQVKEHSDLSVLRSNVH